jgi:hypothetical protein
MHDHVMPAGSLLIHNDTNVGHTAAQIPGDQISGAVVCRPSRNGQALAVPLEKNHQIGDTPVVDIRVGMGDGPPRPSLIDGEIRLHVFVNFLLQVDPQRAVGADDLVGTNTCVRAHITTGVRNANIGWIVSDAMVCPLDGCGHQFSEELLRRQPGRRALCRRGNEECQEQPSDL